MKRTILFLLLSGMILSVFAYGKMGTAAVSAAMNMPSEKTTAAKTAKITAAKTPVTTAGKTVKTTTTKTAKTATAKTTASDSSKKAKKNFYIKKINKSIWKRIKGKSYKADCTVPRKDLRYLHVLHKDLNGKTHEGEMIVNAYIAKDVLTIFKKLYKHDYPIEKIRLVDEYGADDEKSMEDNNSSSFNFRFISHTTKVSKHGLGLAVDINTLYNPYTKTVNGKQIIEPVTAGAYLDRSKDFPYKIDHDDLCYKLFTKRGFIWGGDWSDLKDYQHFEMPDAVVNQLYPNN